MRYALLLAAASMALAAPVPDQTSASDLAASIPSTNVQSADTNHKYPGHAVERVGWLIKKDAAAEVADSSAPVSDFEKFGWLIKKDAAAEVGDSSAPVSDFENVGWLIKKDAADEAADSSAPVSDFEKFGWLIKKDAADEAKQIFRLP